MSIELTYWRGRADPSSSASSNPSPLPILPDIQQTTYLLCPPALTVGHLEKLIRLKFDLKPAVGVAFFFSPPRDNPPDRFSADYTLSDLVCFNSCAIGSSTTNWHRRHRFSYQQYHRPMRLFFSVTVEKAEENGGTQVVNGGNAVALTNG